MKDLLQYKGKNDYFHITTKRAFDEFLEICVKQGITRFSSGKPIDSDEYYNHDSVYLKIKSDGTLAFVNYKPSWAGRVHDFTGQTTPIIATPKAEKTFVNSKKEVKEIKENKTMKFDGIFKGMGFDLTKTDEFGIDLMSGKLAYLGKDTATIIDGKKDLTTTIPDMVKVVPLMFIPTPIDAIKAGDIIKRNNKCGVVIKIDGQNLQIQNYSGTVSSETIAKHALTQTSFVSKLFNPFDGLGAGADGQPNPIMAMLFLGDDSSDDLLSTFMLMQAMQGGVGNPQMASMLPLLLMKDGGKDNIMKLMMLGGMGGGANPFASNPMLLPLLMGDGFSGGSDIKDILMFSMMSGGANPFSGFSFAPTTPAKK